MDARDFYVIPLRAAAHEPGQGLLLFSTDEPDLDDQTLWLGAYARQEGRSRLLAVSCWPRRGSDRSGCCCTASSTPSPIPILLTDTEGRLLIANAARETLFAAPEEESEGRRARRRAEQHAVLRGALEQRDRGGRRRRGASCCWSIRCDGSDSLFELLSTRADGRAAGHGVVSILRNVTDLRRAKRGDRGELPHAAHRRGRGRAPSATGSNLIIDSVADPILVTDAERRRRR